MRQFTSQVITFFNKTKNSKSIAEHYTEPKLCLMKQT